MKTTLDIPDEIMRGMKIRAVTQGKELKDVVANALRESLASSSPKADSAAPVEISLSPEGLAYLKCDTSSGSSGNPAPTFEDLQRLIEESQLEEDLSRAGFIG